MTKILVCRPNIGKDKIGAQKEAFEKLVDAQVDIDALDCGPEWSDTAWDELLIGREMVAKAQKAEKDGYDAFITGSSVDHCLNALKEMVNIPVVGPSEASFIVAAFLAEKFSTVTIDSPNQRQMILRSLYRLGLQSKLASIRLAVSGELIIRHTPKDYDTIGRILAEESKKAVDEDGAQAVIVGTLGFERVGAETGRSTFDRAKEILIKDGYGDIPIIPIAKVALNFAKMLSECGLTQSKRTFTPPPMPPEKDYSPDCFE